MAQILLIDDDAIIRKVVALYLTLQGHEVLTAGNGLDGLEATRDRRLDLILMDMRMPVLDGWEATRMLKLDETTGAIPILALTAQTLKSDIQRCWDAGVDGIIQKPVQLPMLTKMIDAHLLGQPES
ncbi:MAG: response regulator [Anaerolineae bacterium]